MEVDLTAAQLTEIATRGARVTRFPPRTVQYWTTVEILRPRNPEALKNKLYAPYEAVIARLCARLFTLGFSVPGLKAAADAVRPIVSTAPELGLRDASDQTQARLPAHKHEWVEAWRTLESARHGGKKALLAFHLTSQGGLECRVYRSLPPPDLEVAVLIDWKELMRDV